MNCISKVVDASADHRRSAVSDAFGHEFVDEREFFVGEPSRHWGCHTAQYTDCIADWGWRRRRLSITPSRAICHEATTPDSPARDGARATAFLAASNELLLADVIVAETVHVLESFYEVHRSDLAPLIRAVIAFPAMRTLDPALLLRSIEIYETHGVDFAEAYLAASAEVVGVARVASFDRTLDRVPSITRIEP